jgi:glycosyltransferase involved in cell wall biosynthesis
MLTTKRVFEAPATTRAGQDVEIKSRQQRASSNGEILFAWDYLEWGGAQIYFYALMRAAAREGWKIRAFLPEKSAPRVFEDLKIAEAEVVTFPSHADAQPANSLRRKIERRWNKLLAETVFLRHLSKLNLRSSILQIDMAPWSSFLILFLLARKSRVVQTIHTPLPSVSAARHFFWKTKFGALCRMPGYRLLASNEEAKRSLRQFVSADVYEKIEVSYSGINPAEINEILREETNRAEIAAKYDLPPQNFWVLSLGQFIERKGSWVLLDAARKLKAENADVTFVWLSTSTPDAETLAKIESYGLGNSFRLLTPREFGGTRRELLTVTAQTDVFVLASLQEGLPIALCEAMALRKPCVSTRVGAIPEAIENNQTGLLVEAGNADALAEAILNLKNDAGLREKLARDGQKLVVEKFDETKAAQATLKVYRELCDNF